MWLSVIALFIGVTYVSAECDLRYYQHYVHKGCKPILGEDGCPIRYQCETHSDDLHQKCFHNGKWYNQRETIQQDCESCRCSSDTYEGGSFIECAEVDCPDWDTKKKSCYMGYEPGDCCPREMCPSEKDQRKTCTYDGKEYDVGRFVQKSDPCQSCICTESGIVCKKVNCLTGIYAPKIRKGCLPLYTKESCCLTGLYCGNIMGSKPIFNPKNTDGLCHYREQYYELGSTIFPTSKDCFECSCSVPPDFTCLRTKC